MKFIAIFLKKKAKNENLVDLNEFQMQYYPPINKNLLNNQLQMQYYPQPLNNQQHFRYFDESQYLNYHKNKSLQWKRKSITNSEYSEYSEYSESYYSKDSDFD